VPTLWEILPWSFVVDYFTNAGDVINAYSTLSSSIAWRSQVARSVRTVTYSGRPLTLGASHGDGIDVTSDICSFQPFTIVTTSVARDPELAQDYPSLEWKIPGLGLQWVNLAALSGAAKDTMRLLRR